MDSEKRDKLEKTVKQWDALNADLNRLQRLMNEVTQFPFVVRGRSVLLAIRDLEQNNRYIVKDTCGVPAEVADGIMKLLTSYFEQRIEETRKQMEAL